MKFLFHKSNQMIVNSDLVEKFSIHHNGTASVEARLAGGGDKIILKEFHHGKKEENLEAAKKYLVQLVKNCGMKVIFYNDGLEAVNVAFVDKIFCANSDYVIAKTATEEIILQSFDGEAEDNIAAAKNYLADLAETLNKN